MKERDDLVRGMVRKAESDLTALDASLSAGAHDAACFHAQQAAERYLKAYLTSAGADSPHTHNLARLVLACATRNEAFGELMSAAQILTPYAVELRYDTEFWPDLDTADEARRLAHDVRALVHEHLLGD